MSASVVIVYAILRHCKAKTPSPLHSNTLLELETEAQDMNSKTDVVNIPQIAAMANRSLSMAHRFSRRDDFPSKVLKPTYHSPALFNRAEVEQWLVDHGYEVQPS